MVKNRKLKGTRYLDQTIKVALSYEIMRLLPNPRLDLVSGQRSGRSAGSFPEQRLEIEPNQISAMCLGKKNERRDRKTVDGNPIL